MPIPFMDEHWTEVSFWNHCIGKRLLFSFWPRKCYYSNRSLWLKQAYRVTAMWTGPGEPVFENRWLDKHEFLIKQIKGDING